MPLSTALSIAASSVGFVAALFFCVGAIFNSPESILLQATPFWDFSEPIAQSLSAQKAQYLTGGLLLVGSFLLQVLAVSVIPTKTSYFPQTLGHWWLAFGVVLLVLMVAVPFCCWYEKTTMNRVEALYKQQQETQERTTKPNQDIPTH